MRGRATAWGVALTAAALGIALAGCVPGAPTPTPTEAASGQPDPSPTPTQSRELNLDGTAEENLPYFIDINRAWIKAGGGTDGRSLIDNLVKAGFPKNAMEVTPDRTTVNAAADDIYYSVRINGTCLIGQYGNGKFSGTAQPLLSTGKCLVGTTRTIDW